MELERTFMTPSPEATEELGQALAAHVRPGDALALVGDLGAGKTCFVRGLARGLGFSGVATSPTFVLWHTYDVEGPAESHVLHHLDLYRLSGESELEDIGALEALYGGDVCVVEWADHCPEVFPEATVWIRFDVLGESSRRITLRAPRPHFDWIERIEHPAALDAG